MSDVLVCANSIPTPTAAIPVATVAVIGLINDIPLVSNPVEVVTASVALLAVFKPLINLPVLLYNFDMVLAVLNILVNPSVTGPIARARPVKAAILFLVPSSRSKNPFTRFIIVSPTFFITSFIWGIFSLTESIKSLASGASSFPSGLITSTVNSLLRPSNALPRSSYLILFIFSIVSLVWSKVEFMVFIFTTTSADKSSHIVPNRSTPAVFCFSLSSQVPNA